MKINKLNRKGWVHSPAFSKGFTLIEILVGSVIMLIVILTTLSLYGRSHKITIDQQELNEVQHNVRSGMYLVLRDARNAGVGLTSDLAGRFVEGTNAFGPGPEASDSILLWGNFDDPLDLRIDKYQGGVGGGAATSFIIDGQIRNFPYPCPDFLEGRMVLVISTRCPGCFAFRFVSHNKMKGCDGGEESIVLPPGHSELNPPGGFVPECAVDCWPDAIITFGELRFYWLDQTGNPGDYPTLTRLDEDHGYLGIPNTLYLTTILGTGADETEAGYQIHIPLAHEIENLQFQYNGDIDNDGFLDGFTEWDPNWTGDVVTVSSIRQIRMWIVGEPPTPSSAPQVHPLTTGIWICTEGLPLPTAPKDQRMMGANGFYSNLRRPCGICL